jgi:uncharacterized protein (TIGR02444 family)
MRLYAAPGIRQVCLSLQDRDGLNVNCLLLAAWAGALGYRITGESWETMAAKTAPIREKAVAPIRAVRRSVASEATLDEEIKRPLKRLLLYAELRAEQAEERALHRMMVRSAAREAPSDGLFRANLAAYARPSAELDRFATLVVDARFMDLLPCPRNPND